MPTLRCHYEVLEVEKAATESELKVAYRRLALRWHPDKNMHQIDEAEARFKEIRAAYEVLSDANERSWYDAHRDDILAGGDGTGQKHDDGEDLWKYFNAGCFTVYGDDQEGFYTVFREVFEKLEKEEMDADPSRKPMSGFGKSDTKYSEQLQSFYSYWTSFSSRKSFSWKDVYNTTQALNREVRRAMEKENKKERDKAKRTFNEIVRKLAESVHKRDPRYMAHIQDQAKKLREKNEQDKITKERANANIKGLKEAAKEARQAQLDAIDLSMLDASLLMDEKDLKRHKRMMADEEESGEDEDEEFYCPACRKRFKSDKQWQNHENSKKHKEAAAKLRKELLEEEEQMNAAVLKAENVQDETLFTEIDEDDIDTYLADLEAIRELEKKDADHVEAIIDGQEGEDDLSEYEDAESLVIDLEKYKIHQTDDKTENGTNTVAETHKENENKSMYRKTEQNNDENENEDEEDEDSMLAAMSKARQKRTNKQQKKLNKQQNRFNFGDDSDEEDIGEDNIVDNVVQSEDDEEEDEILVLQQSKKKSFSMAAFEQQQAVKQGNQGKKTASTTEVATSSNVQEEIDDGKAGTKKKKRRAAKDNKAPQKAAPSLPVVPEPNDERGAKKLKGKKAQQYLRQQQEKEANTPTCRTCGATFPSKTALHTHLQETKHAIAT